MNKEIVEIEEVEITITKKNIKSFNIRVNTGTGAVAVSAPYSMPRQQIIGYIQRKMPWIRESKRKVQDALLDYSTGETHYLWGKPYLLEVCWNNQYQVATLRKGRIELYCKEDDSAERRQKIINEYYRKQLQQTLPKVMEKCCNIVGKTPKQWRIKNMKTRWGTCNTRERRVWINLQLAKYPPQCLEYVVIHELTHLYVHGHNKEFYAYMDQFYPNWREVQLLLKHKV